MIRIGIGGKDRPDGARRGFCLLRWFAALSLACVLASGIGTAMVLSRFLTGQMLDRDAEVSAEFLQSIVKAERSWDWFTSPGSDGSRMPLESFFNHVLEMPAVVRANVFGSDGTVLWSSNPVMIGRRFADNHELDAALRGRITVEAGTLPKTEHVALDRDADGRRFTEAYLPVWDEARAKVIGVVEIYRLPDALFAAIDEGVRRVWVAAGLSMVLLYAALFGLALRAQRLLERQQQALAEAEALGAIGAVASAVAHGIRNPLASIRSSAELAALEDEEGTRRCLADIQREADRVERWVRDLLLQARGEQVALAAVDVNLVLAEAARSFQGAAARQGVALQVTPGSVPPVRAEAGALAQAVDNLVANAIEAMPEGGRLTISSATAAAGREVEIVIADTGHGLPRNAQRGGGLFFSTKPRGTGLGLVLTRRILERHAGSLTLESGGGGTRAILRLPAVLGA
jgi:two-component system sensor histidine kinase HydH